MYCILQQRIEEGEIIVKHVPDSENASDALTKWVDANKFDRCIKYMAGERSSPV